jgi:glycine/sarcosine N-methyltransferase
MSTDAKAGSGVAGRGEKREERADSYDRFVDWDTRLAREAPFFREMFEREGVGRVIDVGCGTGKHAIMFATWGLQVTGVDPDPSMLARARFNAAAGAVPAEIDEHGGSLVFEAGGFGDLAKLEGAPVDAVTCTGNALPHVQGLDGLRAALADFAAVLRPGGVVVLHLLNHGRLLHSGVRSMPLVVRDTPEGTTVFLRMIERTPDDSALLFDFLTLTRDPDSGEWRVESRRSPHTAMPAPMLAEELHSAGFPRVKLFGDHTGKAFEDEKDESVILVGRRG